MTPIENDLVRALVRFVERDQAVQSHTTGVCRVAEDDGTIRTRPVAEYVHSEDATGESVRAYLRPRTNYSQMRCAMRRVEEAFPSIVEWCGMKGTGGYDPILFVKLADGWHAADADESSYKDAS